MPSVRLRGALAAMITTWLLLPPPAHAQAADGGLSEQQLRELEAAVAADAAANADAGTLVDPAVSQPPQQPAGVLGAIQSMNPDIAVILDVAAAVFSADRPLQTGGHDPREQGFNLQQLEISIGRTVDPYFRFDSNLVLFFGGVHIEEAYATTLGLPHRLQVRAGRFLTRFGRINGTHPHSWDFVAQPFMVGRFLGAEGGAGLGAELSWLAPLPWYVEVLGSANDASTESSARSFYAGSGQGVRSPLDFQLTGAVKQFFDVRDDLSVLWGLSAASGPNSFGHATFSNLYGTDLFVKYRPLTGTGWEMIWLQAEAMWRRRQVPRDVWNDFAMYAQLLYRLGQRWAAGARFEHGSVTSNGAGFIVADDLDPDWLKNRQRYSGVVTFWPTEFSRLRLELSADVPQWEHRVRYAAMLNFEVVVGAHGAHQF